MSKLASLRVLVDQGEHPAAFERRCIPPGWVELLGRILPVCFLVVSCAGRTRYRSRRPSL